MSDTGQELHDALNMARRTLTILEEQAAGYTALTIPARLVLELEEKRKDVACLETQIRSAATGCLLYTSPSPRDRTRSRMPSSA